MEKKKQKKIKINNKKRFILVFSSLFLIFLILSLSSYYFIKYQINSSLNNNSAEKVFIIEKGDGLKAIATNLEKDGIIKNSTWFTAYVFYKGLAGNLQAGEYSLSPNLNIIQISEKIFEGDTISKDIKITIPEGFNLKQIDARLTEKGLIEAGELATQSNLEGYLFPDTYQFNKKMNLDEIIKIMKDNFNNKLDVDLINEIQRQNKTIREIIIMASLIEKEVSLYDDRRIVSGVFWNRLSINYPLQSCATIAYALEKDKWIYSVEDTKIDSPYNTYKNTGLPPGPICNPGLLAIKSAIYPQYTDYYFFLSKPTGETVFSKTFEDHQANIVEYLQ
ncbi:endolytic transglycosylase MltG [Patescibacteria group bacterium]|nr:endolytic transglycosylase MltG [Patescibacteria group bacterium]